MPSLMAAGAVALSFGSVALDAHVNAKLARSMSWLWSGGPDGARALLSTIAGSMMTVTGIVFSITMVTLTLASSQFGSRLLRNFMRDRGNQVTLGTFISTFVYCLLVLRTVRSTNEGNFVPYLSVTAGVALALVSLGVLIFFIHHVAGAIQAESLTAEIGEEFEEAIKQFYGQRPAEPDGPCAPAPEQVPTLVGRANRSGYVLSVDRDGLVKEAAKRGLCVRLVCLPGDFVLRDGALVEAWLDPRTRGKQAPSPTDVGSDEKQTDDVAGTLADAFSLGFRRTPTQDVRYSARQLVEIASRALSPGINDPFTAVGCLDWLAAGLSELARQPEPTACRRDEAGEIRLWELTVNFSLLTERCLEPIRDYAKESALVTGHLLKVLGDLGRCVERTKDRAILRALVGRIAEESGKILETGGVKGLLPETLARIENTPARRDGSWLPSDVSLEL